MRTLASVYSSMNASSTKAMKMLRMQVTVTMWKERKYSLVHSVPVTSTYLENFVECPF